MNSIIMNIRPDINSKIESGEITALIKNNIPKKTCPFKVYTYDEKRGGIVNEWICTKVKKIKDGNITDKELEACGLTSDEFNFVTKNGKREVTLLTIKDVITYVTEMSLSNFIVAEAHTKEELGITLCNEYCKETNYGKRRYAATKCGHVVCKDVYCPAAYSRYLRTVEIKTVPSNIIDVKIK